MALRVRPISVAELEEGATLIAHKVDEQVSGAVARTAGQSRGLLTPVGQVPGEGAEGKSPSSTL